VGKQKISFGLFFIINLMGRIVMSNFGRDNRFRNAAIITVFVMMVAAFAFAPLAAAATNYFADGFENGLGNWVVSGYDWGLTTSDSRSNTHSATDSPNGNYPDNTNASLTLVHPIDLTGSASPVLSFWYKGQTDCSPNGPDHPYVEASDDGGLSWSILKDYGCVNNPTWTNELLDLSSYKTSSVLIRFRLLADGDGATGDGWYIDDVKIYDSINSPPVLSPIANQQLGEGTTLAVQVSASDVDGDLLTLSISNLPAFGTFIDNGNGTGTITFNPGYDAAGDYLINVVASDGKLTDSKSFTLTITDTPINISTGLVAYYPFNGNANDESGNGNNGTVYGATLTTDRFGHPSSAYSFDGLNDYIGVPHSNSLNLTGDYTISAWIFQKSAFTDSRCGYRILDKATAGSCDGWVFDTCDSNSWTGRKIRMDVSCPWSTSNTAYSLNEWHHVVGTVNNLHITFYLDGQQDGEGAVAATPINSLDLYIAASHNNYYFFDGLIDDMRIYNRALSQAEINELYNGSVNYYCDKDTDGYINSSIDGTCTGTGCQPPGCQTTAGNDCNDNDATIHPGVALVISGVQADPKIDSAIITWVTNIPSSSQIEYGSSISYGFETPVSPSLETNHSVKITGLNQNATYHYRVKSRDMCGNEAVSSDLTFVTAADVTPPDTSFISGPPNNGKACERDVNLCWQGTDDFTASSDIQYSYNLDNGPWSGWTIESCHSFAGLPDGLHTVLVKAKDGSGNEDATPAALNFSVDATVPNLTNITAAPRDYNATINWNTSEPATTQVEYGETTAYGMSSPLNATMTATHTVTIDGLTPKTMYHYRVKSNDGCREVASGDMTFTTTDILYPNLRIKQIDMQSTVRALERIDLKWLERNDGPVAVQGSWVDKVFLSTDTVLDPQDTLLGEITFSDGLEWETERLREVTLAMPVMPPGTYYIIVQTDANKVIDETNENDNNLVKRIDYLTVKQFTAAPDQITIRLHPVGAANGEIDLINLGETPLTGITAAIAGNSPNISLQVVPPSTISGKTVQKVSYSVSASDDSVKNISPVIVFSTPEGQTASVTFSITVNPGYPNLVSNPGYLETTMVRGTQTLLEFEVTNNGSAAVSNLKIVLPSTDWLSLVTPDSISSLGRGEKIKVGLALKPGANLPLGPYTGNIALSAANASATVGFRFTAVSDKTGGLKITAKDEFTYFADDHPPVSGAAVKIKNPYDGSMVAEGQTDAAGQFAKLDLFEGFYSIEVSAEKHGTYNAIVQINAGQIKEITAFLPRQLVTYTWKVVPVQTDDKYIVTLEAVFETHVPAPVITVEPMVLDLRTVNFDADGLATVNYKITNHGLIAANNATIYFGTHPDYEVKPLNENIGEIPAMTSLDVPVTIKRLNVQAVNALNSTPLLIAGISPASTGGGKQCGILGTLIYKFLCEKEQERSVDPSMVTGDCPTWNTPGITGGNGGSVVNDANGGDNSSGGVSGGAQGDVVGSATNFNGLFSILQDLLCDQHPCSYTQKQCCDDDLIANPEAGGIVACCNGTLVICVRPVVAPALPRNIIESCIEKHEKVHLPRDACVTGYPACGLGKRGFNSGWTLGLSQDECDAHTVELNCLASSKAQCGGDEACKIIIDCRTVDVKRDGNKYWPTCFFDISDQEIKVYEDNKCYEH
jgi:hypothetical protein